MTSLKPRAVVVEDEAVLRAKLEELLAKVWPDVEIVASAADGVQGLAALDKHRPDVLFLDIEMPGLSGIEVARHASGRCHVVFVTAYSEYAVAAFEAGAIDYVLKPFNAERLALAVTRVRERLHMPAKRIDTLLTELAARVAAARRYLRWITASRGANVRLITVEAICYFQADTKYTRAVSADSEALIHTPLKELIEQLDPALFWQIHRSTIVNVNAIDNVGRDLSGHVIVRLKGRRETLRVSQAFAYRFRQM
jgi:DNA-binding LytR/AlgR family response regulator